jgi:hypothetical protein
MNRSKKSGANHAASAMVFAPLANGRRRIATINGIHDPVLVTPVVNGAWDFSPGVSSFLCISIRLVFSL